MSINYTITKNEQFNSLEISFNGKPCEAVREALKELRFRWHGQRRIWYGYKDEETVRAAIEGKTSDGKPSTDQKQNKPEAVNKYGVRVGDIFRMSWGWEQTNEDFFQVVELSGACSVRVRQVCLPVLEENAVGPMASNYTYQLPHEILPPSHGSIFVDDQERGDLHRVSAFDNQPFITIDKHYHAYRVNGDTLKTYESWYA